MQIREYLFRGISDNFRERFLPELVPSDRMRSWPVIVRNANAGLAVRYYRTEFCIKADSLSQRTGDKAAELLAVIPASKTIVILSYDNPDPDALTTAAALRLPKVPVPSTAT
ncbi:MAG: hypothetical protein AB7G75_04240 [Candidatus Binatia bacterium]